MLFHTGILYARNFFANAQTILSMKNYVQSITSIDFSYVLSFRLLIGDMFLIRLISINFLFLYLFSILLDRLLR